MFPAELTQLCEFFSLEHNQIFVLYVFGTAKIFDLGFFPDGRLVVLYGYRGHYDEQYLRIFDLPGLFFNYPANIDNRFNDFTNMEKYSKIINLPNVGKDYLTLSILYDKLLIYGTDGIDGKILKEFSYEELILK
jgi:hypothetical protein